jgi:hypothetical protein
MFSSNAVILLQYNKIKIFTFVFEDIKKNSNLFLINKVVGEINAIMLSRYK